MKIWIYRALILALLTTTSLIAWHQITASAAALDMPAVAVTLVLPDDLSADDVHVTAWQDAAAEIGFKLQLLSASQLLQSENLPRDAPLILPDIVHRRMNDALVANLHARVQAGARLMLIYDAGIVSMDDQYHPRQSRLSPLAGVRYGLYGELGIAMQSQQVARVQASAIAPLQLPPGKLLRDATGVPLTSTQYGPLEGEELSVASYRYGPLRFPAFVTRGVLHGRPLIRGEGETLLAGVNRVGNGEVLFVNLPLTYLKLRTDGLFLHAFLRYFAQDIAHLPQLSPMPNAQGALVMNWHIDSGAAVPSMQKLEALGAFKQGPYSVHITAGPDVDRPGDGGGMDLENNALMRDWVRRFTRHGDEIGSHGGWIHNAFGRLVSIQPQDISVELIERNLRVVSSASGRAVREYSAPMGNHPVWKTAWLRERGIQAYYFTGDIGMAPTRSYQEGRRGPADSWAFPVMSFGVDAAFEEAWFRGVPEHQLRDWLKDVADFCADHRTLRLVYFHPPGAVLYPNAFERWLNHTAALIRDNRLRWITMAQYADFANQRLQVAWNLRPDPNATQRLQLTATHPLSLENMTWLIPAQQYAEPKVLEGTAQIRADGPHWHIVAGAATRVVIGLNRLHAENHSDLVTSTSIALKLDRTCCADTSK